MIVTFSIETSVKEDNEESRWLWERPGRAPEDHGCGRVLTRKIRNFGLLAE